MDGVVEIFKLHGESRDFGFHVHLQQLFVLLMELPGLHLSHTTLDGLQQSIMDEDVLRLKIEKIKKFRSLVCVVWWATSVWTMQLRL